MNEGLAAGSLQLRRRMHARTLVVTAVAALVALIGAWWVWGLVAARRAEARIERALAAGKWTEADVDLNRWLRRDPRSARALFLAARLALQRGQLGQANDQAEQADRLGYAETAVERLRGLVLARAGRFDQAEPLLRRARARSRASDLEVDQALARGYIESFQFGPATQALNRWQRAAPADPKPYLWSAEIWRRTEGDPAPLIRAYRQALRIDPALDQARLGLAEALRKNTHLAESAAEFKAYLDRKPNDPAGHLGAGQTALALGDIAAAITHLDRALELDPKNPLALLERSAIALRQGQAAEALQLLDRAEQADPADPNVPYRRSVVLAWLDRPAEAKESLKRSQQLRHDNETLQDIRTRLVRSPNDRHLQAQAAQWFFDHGHAAEGLRWAKRVLSAEHDHPGVNHMLAEYYERTGNAALANFYRAAARPKEN